MTVRFNQCIHITVMLALAGCSSGSESAKQTVLASEPMVVGLTDRGFMDKPEYTPFRARYDTVAIQEPFIAMIQQLHTGVEMVVFLGTWCGDSKREVPRFLKIADQAGIPPRQIKLYGVDRKKKSGDGLAEQYKIEKVPTFVFLKNGKEMGRIVESPRTTIEEDMVVILADAKR